MNINEVIKYIESIPEGSPEVAMVIDAWKRRLKRNKSSKLWKFSLGDQVEFKDRQGCTHTGVITKINRVTACVKVPGTLGGLVTWKVASGLLKHAS